jgi:virulence-associated protein VapD
MADDWSVVSQEPTQPAPPASGDPWSVVSQTPAQPAQPPTFMQTAMTALQQDPIMGPQINMGIGAWKQLGGLVGGVQQLVNKSFGKGPEPIDVIEYKKANPDATDEQALAAVNQGFRGPSSQASRAAAQSRADWLMKNSNPEGFFQTAGGFAENLGELALAFASGQPEAGARSAGEIAEQSAKLWKAMEGNSLTSRLLRIGWSAVKSAGEQGAQTYAHTGGDIGQTGTAAAIAAPLGAAGQLAGEGVGAYQRHLARVAQEIQPVPRNIGGAEFTQLASEIKDPLTGAPAASPRASIAPIEDYPEIMRQRVEAWKQLNTNKAKSALANALQDTNDAVNASTVGTNIRSTAPGEVLGQGDRWRYIPPDGSTAMSASEARSAMNDIKQEWLSRDTTPAEDDQFRQAYDDIQQQLSRHDSYLAARPFELHDPIGAAQGVENWGDAASHLESVASAKMQQAGLSQEFNKLVQARNTAQDAFDKAMYSGDLHEHIDAQQTLRQASDDLANFIKEKGAQPENSSVLLQRAYEEQQIANGMRELQNVVDSHFTLREARAKAINRPQEIKGLGTLTDDLEKVHAKYGDVLDPVIGKEGFDHLIEMGDLLESPKAERAHNIVELATSILKKAYYGGRIRGGLGFGGVTALGHFIGHTLGGAAGGAAVLGAHTAYVRTLRRIATNPEVARAFIEGAKSDEPVSVIGPRIARLISTAGGTTTREIPNAPTQ